MTATPRCALIFAMQWFRADLAMFFNIHYNMLKPFVQMLIRNIF